MDVYLRKKLFTEYLFRKIIYRISIPSTAYFFSDKVNPLSDKRLTGGYYLFI